MASLLDEDGRLATDPVVKADILSARFSEHFTIDDGKESVLDDRPSIGRCDTVTFSPYHIKKAIKNIKTNAAAGPDYIPPIFLKEVL